MGGMCARRRIRGRSAPCAAGCGIASVCTVSWTAARLAICGERHAARYGTGMATVDTWTDGSASPWSCDGPDPMGQPQKDDRVM
eukprot:2754144-Prymnesium_polylepis.1